MTIVEAKLTRDTEFLGKMDPFCVVSYKNHRFKTKVHSNSGKTPVWNETFSFNIKNISDDMSFKVFDEDMMENEPVGASVIKCAIFC